MRPGLNILQMIHASEETKNSDFIPDHLVDSPVLSVVVCSIIKEVASTPLALLHLNNQQSFIEVFQKHLAIATIQIFMICVKYNHSNKHFTKSHQFHSLNSIKDK